jgi:hypothetical protein
MHEHVSHFEAYVDFISYVLISAATEFTPQTFLAPEEQTNLENAFQTLFNKFPLVARRLRTPAAAPELKRLLQSSLEAYRSGDVLRGGHILQEFRADLLAQATHRG